MLFSGASKKDVPVCKIIRTVYPKSDSDISADDEGLMAVSQNHFYTVENNLLRLFDYVTASGKYMSASKSAVAELTYTVPPQITGGFKLHEMFRMGKAPAGAVSGNFDKGFESIRVAVQGPDPKSK